MSIIAYSYLSAAMFSNLDTQYTFPNVPSWVYKDNSSSQAGTENYHYSKFVGTSYLPISNRKDITPVYGKIDYSANPTNKEFWLKVSYRQNTSNAQGPQYYTSTKLCTFGNYTGGIWKKVAELLFNATGNLVHRTYAADGITYSDNIIKNVGSDVAYDSGNNQKIYDIRILFDNLAGFVQLYNYTATKENEFLGSTWNGSVAITHVALNMTNPANNEIYGILEYALVADESTLGMSVVPLFVKAEGSVQELYSGTGYANLAGRRTQPAINNSVDLTVNAGQTKTYLAKLQNFTDRALPANHVVRSFKLSAIMEAASNQSAPIGFNTVLKDVVSGNIYQQGQVGLVPNISSITEGNYQRFHSVFNLNPITSAAWTLADFVNLEVGFSITGS